MVGRPAQARPSSAVLRLGASRSITIRVGAVVLVRDGADDTYGAVVSSLHGGSVWLTFTPEGKPRRVPMGAVVSVASKEADSLDPRRVPRFQLPPTTVPRRRKNNQFKR